LDITGQLTDIIYQNESNGYTVAEFETNNEIITIVGYLPFINKGDSLKVFGKYVTHPEYGSQFKIETFEKVMPQTLDALTKYLSGGIIKGIGPATAKKIVDKFGDETISVLKYNSDKLSEIKGITKEKAETISEEFTEKWELWQIVGFLEKFGIGANNCKKIYEVLGKDAINQIKQNPYVLIDITYGVDFTKIDKMALDLGIETNDITRLESAIKYGLAVSSYNGHTCVIKENLILYVKNLLQADEKYIEEAMINLEAKDKIKTEERENQKYVYLNTLYYCEQNIAQKLLALDKSKNIKQIKNFKKKFMLEEEKNDILLSEMQKEAINAVNERNVCVITGGPGTGKTTIIKFIIDLYKNEKKKVVLCAPTGRAAKRMSEATGEEAMTIHRLLAIGKMEESLEIEKLDYPIDPIDADVIIIDEMSMVDCFLMNYILKGIYLGTKLILVGDINQLPSVGPGNVLKDIINSKCIETIELNKIFRQAAQSKIITNAHLVNQGESFIGINDENKKQDFFYINESNQEKIMQTLISLCTGRLEKYGNYSFFKNIQVLTPTKKGLLGTKELNKNLQTVLNKKIEGKQHGERVFKIGDRVMQIKNNYDIYWEKNVGAVEHKFSKEKAEAGAGIFNGELGMITHIDETERQIEVRFDDEKVAWYEYNDLEQLEHAYAITIHKSQGSEFDVVILCVPQGSPMLLTRNLLYTGITRAKEMIVVLGNKQIIENMIENVEVKKRNTGLKHKLTENKI